MTSKRKLKLIALGMLIFALLYAVAATVFQFWDSVIYIGKYEMNLGHWVIVYLLYAMVMLSIFIMSFTKIRMVIAINIALTLICLVTHHHV